MAPLGLVSRADLFRAAGGGLLASSLALPASAATSPSLLKPEEWQMDREQFSSYAKRRSILYDTRAGSFISPDPRAHILSALQRSAVDGVLPRVIFAGEEHTHPLHHAMQYELIKAVNEMDDQPLMIGLEMCWRQHQRALDAFVFGDGSFEKLAKRTAWKLTWGYDLNHYAKVLAYARKERIRVVGLNAPYQLVITVGQVGVHGLPRELAAYLPEMDLSNEAHYRRFAERLAELGGAAPGSSSGSSVPPVPTGAAHLGGGSGGGGGGGGEGDSGMQFHGRPLTQERLRAMYEAQTLMDEYMAASIAGYMSSPLPVEAAGAAREPRSSAAVIHGVNEVRPPNPSGRIVVLAGSDHVRGRVGIPDRVTRRTGLSTFSVVPLSVPWAAIGLPAIDKPLERTEAEWVLYTQPRLSSANERRTSGGGAAGSGGGVAGVPGGISAGAAAKGGPLEPPRISTSALHIGTSAAPIHEI
jgi:hypothetical protein